MFNIQYKADGLAQWHIQLFEGVGIHLHSPSPPLRLPFRYK